MPELICAKCINLLDGYYKFIKQCEENQHILRERLNKFRNDAAEPAQLSAEHNYDLNNSKSESADIFKENDFANHISESELNQGNFILSIHSYNDKLI